MTVLGPRPAPAIGPRRAPAGPVTRPVRTRPARSPFTLTYLDAPTVEETPGVPAGTCLVLRNTGGRAVRSVSVNHPSDAYTPSSTGSLRAGTGLGLCTRQDLQGYASVDEVFVDWADPQGRRHTQWLWLPPVPSRNTHPVSP